MDEAETDVLAYITFPKEHRVQLHSTNPIERVNGEITRRTEVVGIFPMTTPSSGWSASSCSNRTMSGPSRRARCMTMESVAPLSDNPLVSLPAVAR